MLLNAIMKKKKCNFNFSFYKTVNLTNKEYWTKYLSFDTDKLNIYETLTETLTET